MLEVRYSNHENLSIQAENKWTWLVEIPVLKR